MQNGPELADSEAEVFRTLKRYLKPPKTKKLSRSWPVGSNPMGQDLYLHPTSFSGAMNEANIQVLQEQMSKAQTFQCYAYDCYEEYQYLSDKAYHAALESKRGEITDTI